MYRCFCFALLFLVFTNGKLEARTLDRCSLARELYALNVPKQQLAHWTCIAKHESSYRTDIVGRTNKNGSNDYGIFQINNRYWCKPSNGRSSYNGCNISCDSLLTDDITKAVRCAQRVLKQQGWKAWSTNSYCKGKLPSINECLV